MLFDNPIHVFQHDCFFFQKFLGNSFKYFYVFVQDIDYPITGLQNNIFYSLINFAGSVFTEITVLSDPTSSFAGSSAGASNSVIMQCDN